MARPKPKVLSEMADSTTYNVDQILECEGIWAITYDSKLINLKTFNLLSQKRGPQYKKVSFSNRGHAVNLAMKLNKKFKCERFAVVLLKYGDQIYP